MDIDLIRMLDTIPDGWELLETEYFEIIDSPLVLFDSAYAGADLPTKSLWIELIPDRYDVLTFEFKLEPTTHAIVH